MFPSSARRHLAIASLAAATGLVGIGATAPAHALADTTVDLAGVTTVDTASSGMATVRLTQPTRLDFGHPGEFGPAATGIDGEGRIVAAVLEQDSNPVVRMFRLSDCGSPGCQGDFTEESVFVSAKKGILSPGLYHLYVVTDGAPVSVSLSFTSLTGSTSVHLSPWDKASVKTLAPVLPSTGVVDPPAYSASGTDSMGPDGGLMADILTVESTATVAGYFDSCAGPGTPPPAYTPGCDWPPDQGTVDSMRYPFIVDPEVVEFDPTLDFGVIYGADALVPRGEQGTWGQGGYFYGAAALTSESATGMWLSFAPPPGAATANTSRGTGTPSSTAAPSATPSATPAPSSTASPGTPPVNLPNTAAAGGAAWPGLAGVAFLTFVAGGVRRRRRIAPA